MDQSIEFDIKPRLAQLDQDLRTAQAKIDAFAKKNSAVGWGIGGGAGGSSGVPGGNGGVQLAISQINQSLASFNKAIQQVTQTLLQLGKGGGGSGIGGAGGGRSGGGGFFGGGKGMSAAAVIGAFTTGIKTINDIRNDKSDFEEHARYGGYSNYISSAIGYNDKQFNRVNTWTLGFGREIARAKGQDYDEIQRVNRERISTFELSKTNTEDEARNSIASRRTGSLSLDSPFARRKRELELGADDKILSANLKLRELEDRYTPIDPKTGQRTAPSTPELAAQLAAARSNRDDVRNNAKAEATAQYQLMNRDLRRGQRVELAGQGATLGGMVSQNAGDQLGMIRAQYGGQLNQFNLTKNQKYNLQDPAQRQMAAEFEAGIKAQQGEAEGQYNKVLGRNNKYGEQMVKAGNLAASGNRIAGEMLGFDVQTQQSQDRQSDEINSATRNGASRAQLDAINKKYSIERGLITAQRKAVDTDFLKFRTRTNINLEGQIGAANLAAAGKVYSAQAAGLAGDTVDSLYGVNTGSTSYDDQVRQKLATLGIAKLRIQQREQIKMLQGGSAQGVAAGVSLDAFRETALEGQESKDLVNSTFGIDGQIKKVQAVLKELNGNRTGGADDKVGELIEKSGAMKESIDKIYTILNALQNS